MKKIIILGAGIYQVPLIKKAKEMGYYTIVCSISGNYLGFSFADQIYYVDTTDKESVLEIARKENVAGIVTAGTDVAMNTIGYVCDKLNLKGISYDCSRKVTDKSLMKKCFMDHGVSTAKYFEISSEEELKEALVSLNFPLIVKAVDLSGSRGIYVVKNEGEAYDKFRAVLQVTHRDYCIIEEFIEGEEFGAQAFVYDGKLQFVLPHGDYVFKGDTGVPIGHFVPYSMDESIIQQAVEVTEKAAKSLGINNAAMNCDYILKDGKVYVIEIGARSGATCLAELVSIYYGFDYYEEIIKVAGGEQPDFSKTHSKDVTPNASRLLMSDKDGVIKAITSDKTLESDFVVEVQYDYSVGDEVEKFRVGPHRIGHVIVKGEGLKKAEENLKSALAAINIEVE